MRQEFSQQDQWVDYKILQIVLSLVLPRYDQNYDEINMLNNFDVRII